METRLPGLLRIRDRGTSRSLQTPDAAGEHLLRRLKLSPIPQPATPTHQLCSIYHPTRLCQVGSFSAGRTYYVQWILGGRVIAENVRPFTLNSGNAVLLIFASDEEASASEVHVPPGVLLPAPAEIRRLRMCNTSKSFCPHVNFVAAPGCAAPTSCRIHLAPRKSTPSAMMPQPAAAVSAAAVAAAAAAAAASAASATAAAVQHQQQQNELQQSDLRRLGALPRGLSPPSRDQFDSASGSGTSAASSSAGSTSPAHDQQHHYAAAAAADDTPTASSNKRARGSPNEAMFSDGSTEGAEGPGGARGAFGAGGGGSDEGGVQQHAHQSLEALLISDDQFLSMLYSQSEDSPGGSVSGGTMVGGGAVGGVLQGDCEADGVGQSALPPPPHLTAGATTLATPVFTRKPHSSPSPAAAAAAAAAAAVSASALTSPAAGSAVDAVPMQVAAPVHPPGMAPEPSPVPPPSPSPDAPPPSPESPPGEGGGGGGGGGGGDNSSGQEAMQPDIKRAVVAMCILGGLAALLTAAWYVGAYDKCANLIAGAPQGKNIRNSTRIKPSIGPVGKMGGGVGMKDVEVAVPQLSKAGSNGRMRCPSASGAWERHAAGEEGVGLTSPYAQDMSAPSPMAPAVVQWEASAHAALPMAGLVTSTYGANLASTYHGGNFAPPTYGMPACPPPLPTSVARPPPLPSSPVRARVQGGDGTTQGQLYTSHL